MPVREREPGVLAALAAAIHRSLEKDMPKRFSSAVEFREALRRAL